MTNDITMHLIFRKLTPLSYFFLHMFYYHLRDHNPIYQIIYNSESVYMFLIIKSAILSLYSIEYVNRVAYNVECMKLSGFTRNRLLISDMIKLKGKSPIPTRGRFHHLASLVLLTEFVCSFSWKVKGFL